MSSKTGRRGEADLHRTVRLRNHLASVKRSFSAMEYTSRFRPIADVDQETVAVWNMLLHLNIKRAVKETTIGAALGDILSTVGVTALGQDIHVSGHFRTKQRCHDWLKDFVEDRDDLVALVTKCHEERDYRDLILYMEGVPDPIPARPVTPPHVPMPQLQSQHTPILDDGVIDDRVRTKLAKIRPHVAGVLAGSKTLPVYEPPDTPYRDHIRRLNVPALAGNPSLILHNFGKRENIQQAAERLFKHHESICVFYDASGAGKTTAMLERLCTIFGLYFSFKRSGWIGSRDMEDMLTSLDVSNRFSGNVFSSGKLDLKALENNKNITHHRLSQVLLARLTVFNIFLNMFRDHHPNPTREKTHEAKILWTLIQVAPMNLLEPDVDSFSTLSTIYLNASNDYLQNRIKELTHAITTTLCDLDGRSSLLVVFDEAQVVSDLHIGSFASEDQKAERSLLKAFITSLMSSGPWFPLIVSGTALSLNSVIQSIASSDAKVQEAPIHQEGDLSRHDDFVAYFSRFVPPAYLKSVEGELLVQRSFHWVYRFPAALVDLLLRDGFRTPHHVLNAYVQCMTKFRPIDYEGEPGHPSVSIQVDQSYRCLDFTKLDTVFNTNHPLIEHMRNMVLGAMLDEKYDASAANKKNVYHPDLVDSGYARAAARLAKPETLVILAFARWLDQKSEHRFAPYLSTRLNIPHSRPFALEHTGSLYLADALDGTRPIKDLFDFWGTPPAWASETATVVRCHRPPNGDMQYQNFNYRSEETSGIRVVAQRRTIAESLEWLKEPNSAFLFPDKNCGPDCLFLARLQSGKLIWIALQMKNYSNQQLYDDVMDKAIYSITPKYFYVSRKKEPAKTSVQHTQRFTAAMRTLAKCDDSSFCVLRAVVAFPAIAQIGSTVGLAYADDQHPLATLKMNLVLKNDPSRFLRILAWDYLGVEQLAMDTVRPASSDSDPVPLEERLYVEVNADHDDEIPTSTHSSPTLPKAKRAKIG
ncbi:hypothetical protein BXZ70DRAFT_1007485 [Cristinia sonorae]|uniref:Uncharacterized protein n=1 Tax=Cristinia sonorae TaxID=1940300 RepID=A0A8K0UQC1_9AGAR|nr:hypothetical protein BXZ70DRAFT_1007485 [Cristinia sonorae]